MFTVNLLLFFVKLYVGLSSNSISIYSDGVNNLFDSLTGLLSFLLLVSLWGRQGKVAAYTVKKREQLLNFIISAAVSLSAFVFAYNSLERLTYPTPVSYLVKYLVIICITAFVKLMLFFILKFMAEKTASPVLRLISLDSLLDFFITSVTVVTLITAKGGNFAVDAVCGLIISTIVLFSAVKIFLSSARFITCVPEKEKRDKIEELLSDEPVEGICFDIGEEVSEAYVKIKATDGERLSHLRYEIEKQTDIKVNFIICNE